MKTTMLLITAHRGCQGACRCFSFFSRHQTKLSAHACSVNRVNAPHAEIMPVEQIVTRGNQNPWNNLISVPETKQSKEFSKRLWKFTKWSIVSVCSVTTGTTKASQEPQLPLKMPACRHSKATGSTVSSYLIPSRMSLGAISTINTLAVINTVLRQPMARKGSGGQHEVGEGAALAIHVPLFQLPFCASLNT